MKICVCSSEGSAARRKPGPARDEHIIQQNQRLGVIHLVVMLSCAISFPDNNMTLTWTKTDEAPALASYALLAILRAYLKGTGVEIETADISLAGRIVAAFPDRH